MLVTKSSTLSVCCNFSNYYEKCHDTAAHKLNIRIYELHITVHKLYLIAWPTWPPHIIAWYTCPLKNTHSLLHSQSSSYRFNTLPNSTHAN